MNKIFNIILALLFSISLSSCEDDEPDGFDTFTGDFQAVNRPQAIQSQETRISRVISDNTNFDEILESAQQSSSSVNTAQSEELQRYAESLISVSSIYGDLTFVARIPSNADVSRVPITPTFSSQLADSIDDEVINPVFVYSYDISQLQNDDNLETRFVRYQIEDITSLSNGTEETFIHTIFSGLDSSNLSKTAEIRDIPGSGATNFLIFGENGDTTRVDIEVVSGVGLQYTYSLGAGQGFTLVFNDNNTVQITQAGAFGPVTVAWSAADAGIINGDVVLADYQPSFMFNVLDTIRTIRAASDNTTKAKLNEAFVPLLEQQQFAIFQLIDGRNNGDVEFSAETVNGIPAWRLSNGNQSFRFISDSLVNTYQVFNGNNQNEIIDNSGTNRSQYFSEVRAATEQDPWSFTNAIIYDRASASSDSTFILGIRRLARNTPPFASGEFDNTQAVARYFPLAIDPATISGTLRDRTASRTNFQAGTPREDALWYDAVFTANAATGTYRVKNVNEYTAPYQTMTWGTSGGTVEAVE